MLGMTIWEMLNLCCHPEFIEGSQNGTEMFRQAQHDGDKDNVDLGNSRRS